MLETRNVVSQGRMFYVLPHLIFIPHPFYLSYQRVTDSDEPQKRKKKSRIEG